MHHFIIICENQTWVIVRKRLSWVVTSVTLTFDLRPWPFARTLLWPFVITPENFMMIRWGEHSQKGVTDGQTENTICRAAWSQLKTVQTFFAYVCTVWWKGKQENIQKIQKAQIMHREPLQKIVILLNKWVYTHHMPWNDQLFTRGGYFIGLLMYWSIHQRLYT